MTVHLRRRTDLRAIYARTLTLVSCLALLAGGPAGAAPAALAPAAPTKIDWNLTPEQIAASCKSEIATFDRTVRSILARRSARTFETTLLPLENAESDLNDRLVAQTFLFNIST